METSGIYLILCTANGRRYVGSASSFRNRWKSHKRDLKKGKHGNPHLQNTYNKYGLSAFVFSILEICSKDKLIEREQFWLDLIKPEFNVAKFASSPGLGRIPTEESKQKSSEKNKKYWEFISDDERQRRRKLATHPHSEATKKMLSQRTKQAYAEGRLSKQRRPHSPETKEKIKAARARQAAQQIADTAHKRAAWEAGRAEREAIRREKVRQANIGKKVSEKTKSKLRAAARAQWRDPAYRTRHQAAVQTAMQDPEVLKRLSDSHKGYKPTKAHRAKIGQAHKGRKNTPETIEKMRAARRAWWAVRKVVPPPD